MTKTTFATHSQKAHLEKARELTGSTGFMPDAIALAAYQPGNEGDARDLVAVTVFECIRGGRADVHFGMKRKGALSLDLIQAALMLAFDAKLLNLDRVYARTAPRNTAAQVSLIKVGFEFEHRERASLASGEDAIVFSLDRAAIMAAAGPSDDDYLPQMGSVPQE